MKNKKHINIIALSILLSGITLGCSSYRTDYRIETTDGDRFYSTKKPKLNKSSKQYTIKDLDGNVYNLKQGSIHKIETYRHKK